MVDESRNPWLCVAYVHGFLVCPADRRALHGSVVRKGKGKKAGVTNDGEIGSSPPARMGQR